MLCSSFGTLTQLSWAVASVVSKIHLVRSCLITPFMKTKSAQATPNLDSAAILEESLAGSSLALPI